ncbi:MAG: LuxR C-terminal-related transcriptional regulator, partial [Actinomycetota bacterium]|nr:LuxR C-terminal-related transcriptional regulator [Actinomycetota bacterium]
LLAAGANDDSIARQLGVSRRTVFRHLQRLMDHAGSTSRFQLAVHAVRHRWI